MNSEFEPDLNKNSFFPLAVVQWKNLSARTSTLAIIDRFKLDIRLDISQECLFRP